MSYKDKYEHALDRFTAVCKDMFTDLERLKRENNILKAERDKWKTDHELLVDDYKQILIDLNKKDAENKRLREALEDLYSMASSPQWRNDPLYRICELIEKALEQSDE